MLIIDYMDSNLKKRFFSLLENEIINTNISFSLQLLFFCFSKILALQWGSFKLLVEWQMMMETRPWLPYIYIYILNLKKKKKLLKEIFFIYFSYCCPPCLALPLQIL